MYIYTGAAVSKWKCFNKSFRNNRRKHFGGFNFIANSITIFLSALYVPSVFISFPKYVRMNMWF
jgi:hypothetical protein